MGWETHEPPVLVNGDGRNLSELNPFTRRETLKEGVTFQHFAYSTIESAQFKERYYGYRGVTEYWKDLQKEIGKKKTDGFTHWIEPGTVLDDWDKKKNGRLLWKS